MRIFLILCAYVLMFSVNIASADQGWISAEIKGSSKCKDPYMWIWIDGNQIVGDQVRVSEPVEPGQHEVGIQGFCHDGKGGSKSLGSKDERVTVKSGKVKKISFKF